MCLQGHPSDCDYFIYDKKDCQCKLFKVNKPELLHEYNNDCQKLGGFEKPSLELCPAFEDGSNSCGVRIFRCYNDFFTVLNITSKSFSYFRLNSPEFS